MFDIGFPEILLVSVVALLVIGPDRLPETVRTVALWVGRIRRYLSNIKAEIEREVGADEIRRQLHNESIMQELNRTKDHINGIIRDAENQITEVKESAKVDLSPVTKAGEATTTAPSEDEPRENTQEDDGRKQSESGR